MTSIPLPFYQALENVLENVLIKSKLKQSERGGTRIGKILEKQSSFALYLYSEAINSQFYEHLLMITAGINDSLELLDGWPEPTMELKDF